MLSKTISSNRFSSGTDRKYCIKSTEANIISPQNYGDRLVNTDEHLLMENKLLQVEVKECKDVLVARKTRKTGKRVNMKRGREYWASKNVLMMMRRLVNRKPEWRDNQQAKHVEDLVKMHLRSQNNKEVKERWSALEKVRPSISYPPITAHSPRRLVHN